MGTKNNPGKFDCHAKAGDDEPIFTLRAKDPLAPILINLWAEMRVALTPDAIEADPKITEAYNCASSMIAWKNEND